MMYDVINTARAAEYLGCSRSAVVKMIHDGTITSAYMGSPDGFTGRPGYRIRMDELINLKEAKEANENKDTRVSKKESAKIPDAFAIKEALGELQICLGMLSDTIEKLKEAL